MRLRCVLPIFMMGALLSSNVIVGTVDSSTSIAIESHLVDSFSSVIAKLDEETIGKLIVLFTQGCIQSHK